MPETLTCGSLFSGYGGLDLAVEAVFNARLRFYAEFDPAPSRIMARHWPDAPNYGDATQIDWSAVEPVDIISGGSPCQDVSAAGRRAGMNEGTRSNLWVAMRQAIATIQPTYVVWENVRGAHSASAYSAVESEPGLLGDPGSPYLRATGRVAGDLAGLGYDAEWRTVSASSVGAPHRRERVFLLAWRRDAAVADGHGRRVGWRDAPPGEGGGRGSQPAPVLATGAPGGTGPAAEVALLPSPVAQPSGNAPEVHLRKKPGRTQVTDLAIIVENGLLATGGKLLPTPRASHGGHGGPNMRDSAGHYDLPAIGKLLPTPNAYLVSKGGSQHPDKVRAGGHMVDLSDVTEHAITPTDFGTYAPAIERWEQVLGRPVPPPTELSPRGKHRLSEHFTEWMMGLPEGWICDTPGITRRDAIKAAGNGVVPQQAYAALADMTQHLPAREAA